MTRCECNETTQVRYRHTLSVQTLTGSVGTDGHVDVTSSGNWTTNNTIKANIISKGGREFVNGEKVGADVTHLIETRSTATSRAITPKMRLLFGSRVFQILAAYDVDEMREVVRIQVKEET